MEIVLKNIFTANPNSGFHELRYRRFHEHLRCSTNIQLSGSSLQRAKCIISSDSTVLRIELRVSRVNP